MIHYVTTLPKPKIKRDMMSTHWNVQMQSKIVELVAAEVQWLLQAWPNAGVNLGQSKASKQGAVVIAEPQLRHEFFQPLLVGQI